MNMRTLRRQVARERMKKAGVEQFNDKRVWKDHHHKTRDGWMGGYVSYFAANWRKYLDPSTQEYKWATEGKAQARRKLALRKVRV